MNANAITVVNVSLKYISSPISVAVYMTLHSYVLYLIFVLFFEEGFLVGVVLVQKTKPAIPKKEFIGKRCLNF